MPQNDAKELRKLERDLHAKLKLHIEAEIEKHHTLIREQVLCDLLVHQDFCEKLLTAAAEVDRHEAAQLHAVLLQTLTAPVPGLRQQQSTLPCSYLTQLLRQSTVDQVQRVVSMSAQDWVDFWGSLFPQFLVQLELCERSSYDEFLLMCGPTASDSLDSCSAQGSGSCSSCADHRRNTDCPAQDPGCPNQHCAGMQQVVDNAAQLLALGYLLHHVPALEAVRLRLDSASGGAPDLQHWERVVDRLQLTELQEEQVAVMAAEFQRRSHSQSLEGKRLIEDTKQSGLQFAAALQHPPEQQQQQQQNGDVAEAAGSRRSRHPALRSLQSQPQSLLQQQQQAADGHLTGDQRSEPQQGSQESMSPVFERDGSGSWHERLGQQLQAHMHKRLVLHQCMQSFMINTLSTYQLAMLSIASFPWSPSTNLIAEIVSKRVQARHRQQVKDAVQQPRYIGTASAGCNNSDSGVTGLTGPKQARAGASRADSQGKGGKGVGGNEGGGKLTYGQWATRQRERTRAQELALHQRACWAQLGCELPGEH